MKVLLISCYELGHQPFSLASPASYLETAGHQVKCQDLAVESLNEAWVKQADFIAFSTHMHTALRLAKRAAERVRKLNPTTHICFYGLYAGMHSRQLLGFGNGAKIVDSVIGGEFEEPMLRLVQQLDADTLESLTGVDIRGHVGGTSFARQRFRAPVRELLPPLKKYARLQIGDDFKLAGYVEASRGCAHKCLHCPITPVYQGRLRIIPEDVVLDDVRQLVAIGAEHITFGDPDFLNGVPHSMRILRAMHRQFPQVTFDFTAKIEHIIGHRHLFPEMKALNCLFVVSAVELLNDTILAYLDKGHTRSDVETAIQITREAGVTLRPSLMPFTPWTSLHDVLDIFDFVDEHRLHDQIDPVQYSIRLLLPVGSSLLSSDEIQPYLSRFNEESWIYEWTHPVAEMEQLQKDVARCVEENADRRDSFATYLEIRDLVYQYAGRSKNQAWMPTGEMKMYAPRLTEDWFC